MLHLLLVTPFDPLHNDGYNFWSGIGSGSPIFVGIVVYLHRHNCHMKGCWRMGKRSSGDLVLCHRHHPKNPPRLPKDV